MTHRLLSDEEKSVERRAFLKNKVRAGSLAVLAMIAGSQAMAVESPDDQRLSLNPVISVIEQNLSPLSQSTAVGHSSDRYSAPVAAQVNTALNPGDKLYSNGGLMLQIRCPGGSQVNLSGSFDVQMLPAGNSDCAFELSQGRLVTEANNTVMVKSGDAVLTTAGSVASVQLHSSGEGLKKRWQVSLGEASLVISGVTYRISQNGEIALSGGNLSTKTLTDNDDAKTANVLARMRAVSASGTRTDITNHYATARGHYLRLFGRESAPALVGPGRAMDEQQLTLEGAADIVDLSSLQVDENSSQQVIRRETWQFQDQGSWVGTSPSIEVQIPDAVGFIPPGAVLRDF